MPAYTKLAGAVYIKSNFRVTNSNDAATMLKYKNAVNLSLKNRSLEVKDDPVAIVIKAVSSDDEKTMLKLDPVIKANRGIIQDFLDMTVPSNAVNVHLALINSFSKVLASLEMIRELFNDPIKGLVGRLQFDQSIAGFQTALKNMNEFLK